MGHGSLLSFRKVRYEYKNFQRYSQVPAQSLAWFYDKADAICPASFGIDNVDISHKHFFLEVRRLVYLYYRLWIYNTNVATWDIQASTSLF